MVEERLFLNPALKCIDVARSIGSNRTYIWGALRLLGMGFPEYIARFRVCHFIDNAHLFGAMEKEEIAERCGFNDVRMLDRYLKELFGISLTEYMKHASRRPDITT